MKSEIKYRSDNCVIKMGRYKDKEIKYELVYSSNSLIDCFDYLNNLIRKDKNKKQKQLEKELQNFFDFGEISNEKKKKK